MSLGSTAFDQNGRIWNVTRMRPSQILEPGTIGINLKGGVNPWEQGNTLLKQDTRAGHTWYVLPSGKIATTGADWGVLYGEADPDEYLKGRQCFLLQTVDPLTAVQLAIIQTCHERLLHSGPGRVFGLWQFAWLKASVAWNGNISKIGLTPRDTRPTCPFCSQAVAYPFWEAGIPIGKMFGKQDWTAVLPETILQEAQSVGVMLESGRLHIARSRVITCDRSRMRHSVSRGIQSHQERSVCRQPFWPSRYSPGASRSAIFSGLRMSRLAIHPSAS